MGMTLRHKSGYGTEGAERGEVRRLQKLLQGHGHKLEADGLFGKGTVEAVKQFQAARGLGADGIVGRQTWAALQGGAQPAASAPATEPVTGGLDGFRGDLSWVHEREGHAGKAYWPGGASGVTLDPGIDLGHATAELIDAAYSALLTAEQMAAVKRVSGIKGDAAKQALAQDPVLKSIKISRGDADIIFHFAAKPYWNSIAKRFPGLRSDGAIGSVQTALLSLAYNRGARNKGLAVLEKPIEEGKWAEVADLIGGMQQDHKLAGIRKRRQLEADLIRTESMA